MANVIATSAISRVGSRINDGAIADHLALTFDALVVFAKKSIGTWSTGLAVRWDAESNFLIAAIGISIS